MIGCLARNDFPANAADTGETAAGCIGRITRCAITPTIERKWDVLESSSVLAWSCCISGRTTST